MKNITKRGIEYFAIHPSTQIRVVRGGYASNTRNVPVTSASVLLLVDLLARSPAQNEEHRVRNIVLVPRCLGGWFQAGKAFTDILVKDGYKRQHRSRAADVPFKKMWPLRSASLPPTKMDGAFFVAQQLWGIRNYRSGDGSICRRFGVTSPPTCRMLERVRLATESASQVTSANLLR